MSYILPVVLNRESHKGVSYGIIYSNIYTLEVTILSICFLYYSTNPLSYAYIADFIFYNFTYICYKFSLLV